jgi:putative ABC transport system permease protein
MVLSDGLVLGALAGVVGAAVGIGAAAATMPFISKYTHTVPGAFQVKPLEVLGAAVLALLLGLAAALVPARTVARPDILLSLTGRRAPRQPQWRLPVGGLVLIALGAFGVYAGPQRRNLNVAALILVLGVALLEIGAIMCTPILVGTLARLGRVLPLGPRLALRDGARHRGRTTPAVAAMFAAVAGAVAAGTWFVSLDAQHRALYQAALLPNQVAVPVNSDKVAADLATRLKAVLPVTGTFTTHNADSPLPGDKPRSFTMAQPMTQCRASQYDPSLGTANSVELCAAPDYYGALSGPAIGDAGVLARITGISDPAASSMLSRGGVVVFDQGMVHDGVATFQVQQVAVAADGSYSFSSGPGSPIVSNGGAANPSAPGSIATVDIPAVYVNLHGAPDPGYVLSPAAATKLGVSSGGGEMLVLDLSQHISSLQIQHANRALSDAGIEGTLLVEYGYHSNLGILNLIILGIAVLIAAGAAGIATGLSITDGQPDLETLSAVGGSPATRRVLAGSTALIITGLGALVGVPVGFAVVGGLLKLKTLGVIGGYVGLYGGASSLPFVVPWLNIAVAVVGVPLLTALGAMVLTRSEVRTHRRMT